MRRWQWVLFSLTLARLSTQSPVASFYPSWDVMARRQGYQMGKKLGGSSG